MTRQMLETLAAEFGYIAEAIDTDDDLRLVILSRGREQHLTIAI